MIRWQHEGRSGVTAVGFRKRQLEDVLKKDRQM